MTALTPERTGTADDIPPMVGLVQAADLLGRGYRTIQKAVRNGQLKVVNVNSRTRMVPRAEIRELLDCYSTREFADVMGWTQAEVYSRMKSGLIRYRRLSNLYLIPKAVVSELAGEAPQEQA